MDVLLHLLVPLLVLLAARVPTRRALALAPLGLLPDVDALIGPHRAVAHNVFAVALVALVVYAVMRERVGDPVKLAGLAAFAFGSHMLLDLPGGVALLWPIFPQALVVHPAILVDMGGTLPVFLPQFYFGLLPHAPQFADPDWLPSTAPPVHTFVSAGAFAVLWTFAAALAVQQPWRRPRRTHPAPRARKLRHPLEIARR